MDNGLDEGTMAEAEAQGMSVGHEEALFLFLGGIAGALLGVALAHALLEHKRKQVGTKEAIKLAMVLVGTARQIASMLGD